MTGESKKRLIGGYTADKAWDYVISVCRREATAEALAKNRRR